MTEETKVINTETEASDSLPADVETVVHNSPNTKAAEKKLKEMSRKAKERGKPKTATKRREGVIKLNQSWLLAGLGISAILAIGYLIYKSRGDISERQQDFVLSSANEATRPPPEGFALRTSSELQPYHFPPPEKKEETERSSEKPNTFDLNSF